MAQERAPERRAETLARIPLARFVEAGGITRLVAPCSDDRAPS